MRSIVQLHRFLTDHAFYALSLSTLLSCALLAARVYLTGEVRYIFLVWNLFLAWLPYFLSLYILASYQRQPEHVWRLLLPGGLWLLFLPNAPYLITDLVHLRPSLSFAWWYDLGLFVSFAWSGCFLAVVSLHTMRLMVRHQLGRIASWVFVILISVLSGFGIYLGRFLRWNSWDLFVSPLSLLSDISNLLLDPTQHRQGVGVTLLFAAIFFVSYLMIVGRQSVGVAGESRVESRE